MSHKRIKQLAQEWLDAGKPEQEGFEWIRSRSNWKRDIDSRQMFISNLPAILNRREVRLITSARTIQVVDKFLATMIWGYGDLGYGSFRVKTMFSTSGFQEKLQKSYAYAAGGDHMGAYEYLSKNPINQLGPAFGTKWIFFIGSPEFSAPIYDSVVSKWIERFASKEFSGIPTSSTRWNLRTYSRYHQWMNQISSDFGINAGELELIIFQDALSGFPTRSKWARL